MLQFMLHKEILIISGRDLDILLKAQYPGPLLVLHGHLD